ncbi:unnamed protein product [Musa textilis]
METSPPKLLCSLGMQETHYFSWTIMLQHWTAADSPLPQNGKKDTEKRTSNQVSKDAWTWKKAGKMCVCSISKVEPSFSLSVFGNSTIGV